MSSKPSPARPDHVALGTLLGVGLALLAGGSAALAAGEGFDRAVRGLGRECVNAASTACARSAFDLADANGDGRADLAELSTLNDRLRVWTRANGESVPPADLKALNLGFVLVDSIGLQNWIALYDTDGDGALTFAEATADLRLDQRPVPELVRTRELVDWQSLRQRFGAMSYIFDYLSIR